MGDSNFIVAIGTIALAVTGVKTTWDTRKSIKAAEKSAKASQESAEATKVSVERMKDALIPYFDLSLTWDHGLILTIRNVGPGLGKIRLVTVRNDISFDSVWDPTDYWSHEAPPVKNKKGKTRIRDFVVGSKEEYSFQLQSSPPVSSSDIKSWLSSLSVFYEDVYDRVYRSRIVYTWYAPEEIRVVGKESFPDELSLLICSNIQQIYDIEGEKPVAFNGCSGVRSLAADQSPPLAQSYGVCVTATGGSLPGLKLSPMAMSPRFVWKHRHWRWRLKLEMDKGLCPSACQSVRSFGVFRLAEKRCCALKVKMSPLASRSFSSKTFWNQAVLF